jgi:hypothetical protein
MAARLWLTAHTTGGVIMAPASASPSSLVTNVIVSTSFLLTLPLAPAFVPLTKLETRWVGATI